MIEESSITTHLWGTENKLRVRENVDMLEACERLCGEVALWMVFEGSHMMNVTSQKIYSGKLFFINTSQDHNLYKCIQIFISDY